MPKVSQVDKIYVKTELFNITNSLQKKTNNSKFFIPLRVDSSNRFVGSYSLFVLRVALELKFEIEYRHYTKHVAGTNCIEIRIEVITVHILPVDHILNIHRNSKCPFIKIEF